MIRLNQLLNNIPMWVWVLLFIACPPGTGLVIVIVLLFSDD